MRVRWGLEKAFFEEKDVDEVGMKPSRERVFPSFFPESSYRGEYREALIRAYAE